MDIKPLFGLCGVLIAAITSEFNDQVTSVALTDVRGALGISHDAGTWIESLYVSAEIVGMAISPWLLVTFTLRRWTLFAIALCGASSVLIPFSPNIEAIYALRLLQGLAGGMIIPLLMTTAFRVLTPDIRLYGLAVYALTATFTPALASTVAALWTDIVDWRFVFYQTIPLCSLAGVLVWYCLHQDQPRYERFRMLDWRGAVLLDYKRVDSRVVSLVGLGLILASCIGSSFLTVYWNRDQFYLWQLLQAIGQPMVIMPLLMMSTNTVAGPAEGPFAAALINTSRAVAEATSAWFLALIDRWRNALHSDRIIDEVGQDRWRVIQSNGVLDQYPPPLTPDGQPRVPHSLEAFSHAVEQQVTILSTSDTFLILGALTVFLMVVVMTLPVRTLPPRILFAKH